ncbi:hypothetical protein D8B26_003048 [Coccidioides posadasii str. Silveira]|uniref:Uncharacterized protein n=1 Tax=Coccidioides posadasii (strain RMSCC 757 / Silveira) TaxID=443226 RepID=E9CZG0_COCPS|nr:conserved hypothetical protein [Coccidioides posadasii str. Silveira]QVM08357.1 hypothetical protein D8B26_003048 [Coccidioides posadasii str. Silveira]
MAQAAETAGLSVDSKTSSSSLDPSLRHFADPTFDPVDFLNDSLPPLARQSETTRDSRAASVADLSSQTQSLLSQLSAQNARLSNTLTQLTDEILRSGGRLAYEVEVLRGDTIGLSDTLSEVLHDDIQKFVPEGLLARLRNDELEREHPVEESADLDSKPQPGKADTDPEYIRDLRTLSQVRAKLEDVIHTFGEAMEWPLPPSEVSLASSFISVSAPEPGPESNSREEKGREVARRLKNEVVELLDSNGGGQAGLEAASRRVESLRQLATVWKGTIEEKARLKFVDSLAKLVEERRKLLDNQSKARDSKSSRQGTKSPATLNRQSSDYNRGASQESSAGGLFRNLQRLRDEIYLE